MADVHSEITDNIDVWTGAVKKRNTTGRGSSKKIELTGITKLRELILELAIKGRLVPQNQDDEPAAILLEKIDAERKTLLKFKKIKNSKLLPKVGKEEMSSILPQGWEWTRLGTVAEIGPRNNIDDETQTSFIPMPLITTGYKGSHGQEVREWSEIKKGYTHFSDGDIGLAKITPCFENSKAAVFSELKNGHGAGTTELHVARPIGEFLNRLFVLLYLKAPQFLLVGKTKMTGSAGQKRVPKDFFAGNPMPFPPLAEQHRIVAKVDELMALCDQLEQQTEDSNTAHKTLVETLLGALTNSVNANEFQESWKRIAQHFDILFTNEDSIDQLKQTILQLAVMGKLVPQDPNDLPAPQDGKWFVYVLECEDGSYYKGFTQDILNRWKQYASGKGADWTAKHPPKKLVHWEEFNDKSEAIKREKELKSGYGRKWLAREIAAGRTRQAGEPASVLLEKIAKEKERLVAEKKITKQKALPDIDRTPYPFDIPKGWAWCRLEDVVDIQGGITKGRKLAGRELITIPYLSVANVQRSYLELGLLKEIDIPVEEKDKYQVKKRDLLITEGGDWDKVGRTAIWSDELPYVGHQNHVFKARIFLEEQNEVWLEKYLNGGFARDYFAGASKQTTNLASINKTQLRGCLIAIPPEEEIKSIVSKLDELVALCDQLKARLSDAQTTQLHFADAIVEQAVG